MSIASAQPEIRERASSAPALFDTERMRNYPRIFVAAYVLAAIFHVLSAPNMMDSHGRALGYDFVVFWGASDLTLQGKPEAAFDMVETIEAERKAVPGLLDAILWHYPPTFQLLIAPLALLPYWLAWVVFVGGGLVAYLFACRPLLNQPYAYWILAAFPPVLICIFHGQNSFYSAALFAGAILLSERGTRGEVLAGICLGMLAFKPQFGVLIPIALMVSGRWRIFISAAVTLMIFVGVATAVFGIELWRAFFDDLPFVRSIMESGYLPWVKMPTAWVFFRYFGVPEAAAYVIQVWCALGVAGVTAFVWWRCGMTRLSWAVLVTASLLVSPYLFDYEFTLLAIPLAVLASEMAERGVSMRDKIGLLVIILMSGFSGVFAWVIDVQAGFLLLLGMLGLLTQRALKGRT